MVAESKASLRKLMLEKRDSLSPAELTEMSAAVVKRLFEIQEFFKSSVVGVYLSKGSEVMTDDLIFKLVKSQNEVLVPVTKHEIEFVRFTSFGDLKPAKFGVLEPETKIMPSKSPDAVIVPGVAFDLDMHRLGYGKGYYDKLFSRLSTLKIGVCFDFQVVEKLPRHEHDKQLDILVTEKRVIFR